jgi:ABC-type polysaccharide/polyol phosphate export permease
MSQLSHQVEDAAETKPAQSGLAPTEPIDSTVRVTVPVRRRVRLPEVWTSFPVARMLGLRDMRIRYKQSALGPLWLVLQPLGLLLALYIVFSGVTSVPTGDSPYVLFAMVGVGVWTYVQMCFTAATTALPSNHTLVRRSACPRVALVTGLLVSVLPQLGVMLSVSVVAAALTGHLPIQAVLAPVMLAWLFAFTLGMALLVAAMAGRFRDVVAFAPLVLQAGIFLTPVGYSLVNTPGRLGTILSLNPVSGLIEAWRWTLLDLRPDEFAVVFSAVATVGVVILGWYVFGRMETRFADYV